MRIRINDAPYLPVPMVDEDQAYVTIGITFARDVRSPIGDFDKCEVAGLMGIIREALESSEDLRLRMVDDHYYAAVELECYVPNDDSHHQLTLLVDDDRQVVTTRP